MVVRIVVERGPKGKKAVEFAKRLGLREPEDGALTPQGLHDFRDGYVATITG